MSIERQEEIARIAREVRTFCHEKFWYKDAVIPSAGNCGFTSATLVAVLREYYPESTWFTANGIFDGVHGGNHCWCQDAAGNIIDPTADQFGEVEIVFTQHPDRRYLFQSSWKGADTFVGWYAEWRIHHQQPPQASDAARQQGELDAA